MWKYEDDTFGDYRAEDQRDLEILCKQIFHIRVDFGSHSLLNSLLSGMKEMANN